MPARNRSSTPDYIAFLGRMIRATGRRVAKADTEDLALLCGLRATLDAAIQDAVNGLRDNYTWRAIGEATGTSKEAAIQKWGTK